KRLDSGGSRRADGRVGPVRPARRARDAELDDQVGCPDRPRAASGARGTVLAAPNSAARARTTTAMTSFATAIAMNAWPSSPRRAGQEQGYDPRRIESAARPCYTTRRSLYE